MAEIETHTRRLMTREERADILRKASEVGADHDVVIDIWDGATPLIALPDEEGVLLALGDGFYLHMDADTARKVGCRLIWAAEQHNRGEPEAEESTDG
jgi:hypothetical protein